MKKEFRQREYDGKWSVWGEVSVQRDRPQDWVDKTVPLLTKWVQIDVLDVIAEFE